MLVHPDAIQQRVRHLFGNNLENCQQHVMAMNKALAQLQRAVLRGQPREIRSIQRRLLSSFSARWCCLILSAAKKDGLTPEKLMAIAEQLDLFADPGEPVEAYAKIKSARGDWRPIVSFGHQRKAMQRLVGLVLEAKFGSQPMDFMARGRGAEVAADQIASFINDGINHFVVADIEACFRSVKQEEIGPRLGLPQEVVRNCLLIREEVTIHILGEIPVDSDPKAFSEAVRQGIPQGAHSSNRVMSLLIGPDLGSMIPLDRVVLYGDDIAIACHTRKEAEQVAKTLPEIMASHPAGPFRLKRCEVVNPADGFNFLKYRFKLDTPTLTVKIRPSDVSYHRFTEKVRQIIRDKKTAEVYGKVLNYRRRWLESFRRYDPEPEQLEQALILLWQSTIESLPSHLRMKWETACEAYASSAGHHAPPIDDWLEVRDGGQAVVAA